jgi:methylglutaconyl-CoA hydratase
MSAASTTELVELRRDEDLLWVTLNDPRRSNALSPAMIAGLTEVFERPWRGEGVRALLVGGAGDHFCAGADLAHLASLGDAGPEENREDSQRLRRLFESLLRQEALTIALVHGACVAGGCGLATACDFVVAAEDARFLYSEVRIGFVAALVATYLPLRCRGADIRELLLKAEFVSAGRALELGLANRVVPAAALAEESRRLAVEILTRASSEAIARTKQMLLATLGRPLSERLDAAAAANAEARATEDCRRGIATFLSTKRSATWR